MITATRYHDFSYGHRVYGHEGRCRAAHGHNGRVHFTLETSDLDDIGRVIDFGEIGRLLCSWVESNWDHRFLLWEGDPWVNGLRALDDSIVLVSFNPTAENLAKYLCTVVGLEQLKGLGVVLTSVKFEETRKCSATFTLTDFERHQAGLKFSLPLAV